MAVIVIFKEAEPIFGWIMFCGLFVLDAELAVVCACVVMPIKYEASLKHPNMNMRKMK